MFGHINGSQILIQIFRFLFKVNGPIDDKSVTIVLNTVNKYCILLKGFELRLLFSEFSWHKKSMEMIWFRFNRHN